jgi:hypothetical protein
VWELLVDLGTPHPAATVAPPGWQTVAGATPLAPAVGEAEGKRLHAALLARDAELGKPPEGEMFLTALARFAEPGAWIYRPSNAPFEGLAAAAADERTASEVVHSEPSSGTISAAGDWGCTLGSMTIAAGESKRDAHYMRLWHRAPGGTWKLFLDTFALMPPRAPPAE